MHYSTKQALKDPNKNSTDKVRRNHRAWLRQLYGDAGLAKCFLKMPLGDTNKDVQLARLLEDWQSCPDSEEYQVQRLRSLPSHLRHFGPNTYSSTEPCSEPCSEPHILPDWGRGSAKHDRLLLLRSKRRKIQNNTATHEEWQWFI